VDHLVRGAAEDEADQVAPASRAHDDGTDIVGLGVVDDLAGGVAYSVFFTSPCALIQRT
jgi:hypothetical protein